MPLNRRPPPPSLSQSSPSSSPSSSNPLPTSPSYWAASIPLEHLTIRDRKPQQSNVAKHHNTPFPHMPQYAPLDSAASNQAEGHLGVERMPNKSSRVSADGEGGQNAPSSYHPAERPLLPHRNSSFSKRHASFDSPREVPLPYMPSRQHHAPYTGSSSPSHSRTNSAGQDTEAHSRASSKALDKRMETTYSALDRPSSDESCASSDPLPSAQSCLSSGLSMQRPDTPMDVGCASYYVESLESSCSQSASSSSLRQSPRSGNKATASSVHLFSRPLSSPEASTSDPSRIYSPTPVRPSVLPDRSSTASLPVPMHTPFHTLPAFPESASQEDRGMGTSSPPGFSRMSIPPHIPPSSVPSSSAFWPPLGDLAWMHDRNASPPPASQASDCSYSSASSAAVTERPIPPPAPPTVLTPPPRSNEEWSPRAPHDSFLAHSPPPTDSYIAVETNPREYRLLVRLPGFRRDAITLSTRKRRILHVVADSWEPGGGHFERRISFGYDADLAQVRAEFDGEFLRVIVPRRAIQMTYWGSRA